MSAAAGSTRARPAPTCPTCGGGPALEQLLRGGAAEATPYLRYYNYQAKGEWNATLTDRLAPKATEHLPANVLALDYLGTVLAAANPIDDADAKGRVVKEHDHLMDATRYVIVSGRKRMKTKSGEAGSGNLSRG